MPAIIFDLDGTLLDSAPDIHHCLNAALEPFGKEPLSLATVRSFIGRGAPTLVERACAARSVPVSDVAEVLDRFLARYDSAVDRTRPYPGIYETLDTLALRGHELAICTNKPIRPALFVLEHFDLSRRMKAVFGGDSLPERKPDPGVLRAAMKALSSNSCIFVGDSETDCETAAAAGVPFVLFTEGYRQAQVRDLDHRAAFERWSDLPEILETILAESWPT